jgi:hypothetical protein
LVLLLLLILFIRCKAASGKGGAIYITSGAIIPTSFTNCKFIDNDASSIEDIYVDQSTASITWTFISVCTACSAGCFSSTSAANLDSIIIGNATSCTDTPPTPLTCAEITLELCANNISCSIFNGTF